MRARLWTAPAEDVPAGAEARVDWLHDWWERLDAWLDTAPATDGRPAGT